MRVRLPLYGKILAWFFLNLVVIAVVVVLLFNAQFHFNLDWLFVTGARERMEAVRDLIVVELTETPPDEWRGVIARYSEAHHVRFALFDDEARPLVSDIGELPEEVRERITAPPTFGNRKPATSPAPATPRGPERRWWPRAPLRALLRTTNPTNYWLLASARLDNPLGGDALRVVLIAKSSSITGGGLIFDPKPWLKLGFGVVVFSLLFWLPLVRGITRTLGRMMHATRQIADGRFDVRVNMRRGDELGALGESIDQMAGRLDGLVSGQKRFLGDIAHELCSPLARLQMALGILEQRADESQKSYVKAASEKAEQIAGLVGEILSFSKASFGAAAIQLQSVNAGEAAAEAVRRERTESSDIRIEIADDIRVAADPDLLIRALSNLLRNAIKHASGPITIEATASGDDVVIVVADSGPGVPAEELPKIFDAFYRLDTSRARETGGTGLGLAIVKTCIESCCGTVTAHNRDPHGLEMRIHLHTP